MTIYAELNNSLFSEINMNVQAHVKKQHPFKGRICVSVLSEHNAHISQVGSQSSPGKLFFNDGEWWYQFTLYQKPITGCFKDDKLSALFKHWLSVAQV